MSKQNIYQMVFANRKFSLSESKITDGQITLTKTMFICCNSVNITWNSNLMTQKTHKTQKDKKLVPQNNKYKMQTLYKSVLKK